LSIGATKGNRPNEGGGSHGHVLKTK
jgi:hypothetical protein